MSKNVLITGATSGIGEATVRAFAKEGANLILTGRRVERLEALKEELQATYPNQKVWTFALDVTDMAMVKDVCQAILKSVGQVHVLVNNAGLALGLTAYQDYEEWDMLTMLDTNVKGLMMVTRQILPSMVAANEGHIINMGSTAGIYAYAGAAVYSATKAAVKTFSDGLRSRAGNFTMDELREGIEYAHARGVDVHVASNMVTHEGNEKGAGEWFRELRDMGLDAVIVSDPALIEICSTYAPGLNIHLSTQASATNVETFHFWKEYGLTRVVLAREVTMEELAEIRKRTDLEIEAFVHGAMCISYSGRCTLSNHMSDRDANRGGCSQSCRWKYDLYDMPFGQERKSIHGEVPEEYSMSAVDMCMIENIPDLIDNGVDSLKIEGRMKSVHYVSTVANCYKAACDAYMESAEAFYAIKDDLINELWKVAQRELATGFYYKTPTENEQLFGARRKIPQYKFVGEVVDFDPATMTATIRQRNVILEGDHVEFYGPGFRHFECDIKDLHDANGNKIDRAPNPMELLTITVPQEVKPGDMIRSTKEGLINLYQKDGSSKTVRA